MGEDYRCHAFFPHDLGYFSSCRAACACSRMLCWSRRTPEHSASDFEFAWGCVRLPRERAGWRLCTHSCGCRCGCGCCTSSRRAWSSPTPTLVAILQTSRARGVAINLWPLRARRLGVRMAAIPNSISQRLEFTFFFFPSFLLALADACAQFGMIGSCLSDCGLPVAVQSLPGSIPSHIVLIRDERELVLGIRCAVSRPASRAQRRPASTPRVSSSAVFASDCARCSFLFFFIFFERYFSLPMFFFAVCWSVFWLASGIYGLSALAVSSPSAPAPCP